MSVVLFNYLPEELIEHIFIHLSPYGEIQACRLVDRKWNRLANGTIFRLHRLICSCNAFSWFLLENRDNIAERCSHAACYSTATACCFVFGGCTASYTTFNDLWRFDLSRRCWIRPLPMGTYPSPKACATMVDYKGYLVLYGGWSKSSPNPIHQTVMFFRELHIYDPKTNFWTEIICNNAAPPLAGHSATIIRDQMIIFGGSYGSESTAGGISHGSGISNTVWVFSFLRKEWFVPPMSATKPSPRYGQTQVKIDERHILVIGGCGGPNLMFSDVWLLTIAEEGGEWRWDEVTVLQAELSAPQIWSHPGCLVGDRVLFLSRRCRPPQGASASQSTFGHSVNISGGSTQRHSAIRARIWVPPNNPNAQRMPQRGPASSGNRRLSLVPPRRRLISSKSLDEQQPPPSPKSVGGPSGDRNCGPIGELQRARSIPAIIVGEIPKLVVTHSQDCVESGSCCNASVVGELNTDLRGSKEAAHPNGPEHVCTHEMAEPSTDAGGESSIHPNRTLHCVAMASSNFVPNEAELVEASTTFPNIETDNANVLENVAAARCSKFAAHEGSSQLAGCSSQRYPSVKPNAMNNRERQLQMLQQMENYLRSKNMSASAHACDNFNVAGCSKAVLAGNPAASAIRFPPSSPPPKSKHNHPSAICSLRNPLQIYALNIADVLLNRQVTWSLLEDPQDDVPEDTILYSLVKGRGELILFGGMRSGASDSPGNLDVTPFTHMITNQTYILKPCDGEQMDD